MATDISNFEASFSYQWLSYLMQNLAEMNVTEPY